MQFNGKKEKLSTDVYVYSLFTYQFYMLVNVDINHLLFWIVYQFNTSFYIYD